MNRKKRDYHKMKQLFYIFTIALLMISCTKEAEADGFWRLNIDEEIDSPFFPYELSFHQDTLRIIDGYNFKQKMVFRQIGDSISIVFANGYTKKYLFEILSDSTLHFAGKKFFRTSEEYFSKTQNYQLLGWKSQNEFIPNTNSTVVHLIRNGDLTQVILNDITSNLKDLRDFLVWYGEEPPSLYLYIGKGIELKDLVDAYCWIKYGRYETVELITSNTSFVKFSSIQDFVEVGDSAFDAFIENNELPPLPSIPHETNYSEEIREIYVNSGNDLNFSHQSDSGIYRYNFSTELDILKYLELSEKINNRKVRRIKRFINMNSKYSFH